MCLSLRTFRQERAGDFLIIGVCFIVVLAEFSQNGAVNGCRPFGGMQQMYPAIGVSRIVYSVAQSALLPAYSAISVHNTTHIYMY